jgi:hypothetical protein
MADEDLPQWIMHGDEVEAFAYSLMLAGGRSPEEDQRKINEIKIRIQRGELEDRDATREERAQFKRDVQEFLAKAEARRGREQEQE